MREGELAGQAQRRLTLLQGLLRIAERPQHPGRKGQAERSGLGECQRAMTLRIVERAAAGQVLKRRRVPAEVLERLAERAMRLHEEDRIAHAFGQAEEALRQLPCRLVLGPDEIELPQPHQRREELRRVAHLATELESPIEGELGLGSRRPPDRHQRRAESGLEDQLLLDALWRHRQLLEQRERLLTLCDRFDVGGSRAALLARALPVRELGLGQAGLGVVMGELLDLLGEWFQRGRTFRTDRRRVDGLERLGHRAVKEPPAWLEQPAIGDVSHPVVREVQLVSHRLEHVVAHQLLDGLGRIAFVHGAGRLKQREVERPSDHGGHRRHLPAHRPESVQSPGDEVADAPRQGQGTGLTRVRQLIAIQRADRFHGDERIPLAHGPDLFLHAGERRGIFAGATQRSDERDGVGARERPERHRCGVGGAGQVLQRSPGVRRLRKLFLTGGDDQQRRPRRDAATHEGQEAQAHLVRPVRVLQDEDQRLATGDVLDQLGHALEQEQCAVARRRQGADACLGQ